MTDEEDPLSAVTPSQWQAMEADLNRLADEDPEIAAAQDRLDQTIYEITSLPPKRRYRKALGGKSEPMWNNEKGSQP